MFPNSVLFSRSIVVFRGVGSEIAVVCRLLSMVCPGSLANYIELLRTNGVLSSDFFQLSVFFLTFFLFQIRSAERLASFSHEYRDIDINCHRHRQPGCLNDRHILGRFHAFEHEELSFSMPYRVCIFRDAILISRRKEKAIKT